jgi:DNA-binding NtrC family response regulator
MTTRRCAGWSSMASGERGSRCAAPTSSEEALAAMANGDFDAALVDINMPQMNGLELSRRLLDQRPDLPIIVITAFGSLETAIAAIRAGAYDFVTKPFEIEQLVVAADRACQTRQLREEVRRLREVVTASPPFADILGESAEIRRLCHVIDAVAQTDSTVLVTGESGTGKELVARALHERGPRKAGPFVAMNCAAMTDTPARKRALRPCPWRLYGCQGHPRRSLREGRHRNPVSRRDRGHACWHASQDATCPRNAHGAARGQRQ